jgi:hypothetical protein
MPRSTEATVTISERKLEALMRKVVRQVVHEEFEKLVKQRPEVVEAWMSNPDSPLYQDMQDLLKRSGKGHVRLHTYDEVFGG